MFYKIKVHEDGDIEVTRVKEINLYNTDLVKTNLDDVKKELKSYGLEDSEIEDILEGV